MKQVKFLLVVFLFFLLNMNCIYAEDDSYFMDAENGFLSYEMEDASKAVSMVEQNRMMRSVTNLRILDVPFKVTRNSDGNYFMWSDLAFVSYGNRVGYCIDPLTKFKTTVSYDSLSFDSVLSEQQRNDISTIMYYGYTYPNHQTDQYYLATQKLIWEYLGYRVRYYQENSNFSGYYDIEEELLEMNRLISNLKNDYNGFASLQQNELGNLYKNITDKNKG